MNFCVILISGSRVCPMAAMAALALLVASLSGVNARPAHHPPKQHNNPLIARGTTVALPAGKSGKQNQRKEDHWWSNPCAVEGGGDRGGGSIESSQSISTEEESSLKPLHLAHHRWIIQLKMAILHLHRIEVDYKDIKNHISHEQFQHEWLPEFPSDWLEKQAELKPVRALTELYKGLQRYAATLECLMTGSGCKFSKNNKKRRRRKLALNLNMREDPIRTAFLLEVKTNLQTLLCEVQMFLRDVRQLKLPVAPSTNIINANSFAVNPDQTKQLAQDWGVLSKFMRYLIEWDQIASRIVQPPVVSNKSKKVESGPMVSPRTTNNNNKKKKNGNNSNNGGNTSSTRPHKNRHASKKLTTMPLS